MLKIQTPAWTAIMIQAIDPNPNAPNKSKIIKYCQSMSVDKREAMAFTPKCRTSSNFSFPFKRFQRYKKYLNMSYILRGQNNISFASFVSSFSHIRVK